MKRPMSIRQLASLARTLRTEADRRKLMRALDRVVQNLASGAP